ncbi:hypothetical protein [Gemella sanguinis]|uniref:hypothetical protein n=1 Tax=Gemella sanguinis TaxID=84135 RepID=UPI000807627E|nr:hypothetical protein [Gemella sanguinis]
MTNEELLMAYQGKEFVKYDTGVRDGKRVFSINVKKTFKIEAVDDYVELTFTKIGENTRPIETKIIIKDDTEEYPEKTEYLSNIKKEVSVFLKELKVHHLVEKIFDKNGIKINEKDYTSTPIPGEEN